MKPLGSGVATFDRGDLLALLPLWLVVLLLPFGRSAELGTLVAIVVTLLWLLRRPREILAKPASRLVLLLLAAYCAAALLSALDAIRPARSWETCLGLLRYAALGMYAAVVLDDLKRLRATFAFIAAVVVWWALDAWLQLGTGWSLGGPAEPERITGIFGAGNPKLGIVLATLSPFVLWVARQHAGRGALIAAFAFLLVPILVAGSRQGWLCYALVTAVFVWRESGSPKRFLGWMGAALLLVSVAGVMAWYGSPRFESRISRSMQVFDGTEASLNTALSGRLDIWRTALGVFAAHPVNGVGVRDFRYAYPRYAEAGDRFVTEDNCGVGAGACHPHQWLLEVASETGILGLALWFAALALAWRTWRRAGQTARDNAFPLGVALATALFPLNTHLAFYSAWWGLLFWWLLALWCAAIRLNGDALTAGCDRS